MRRTILIATAALLLAACGHKPQSLELTDWQFEYNGQWYPATVPGFIHTDLMANGIIPDPYYGTNEDSVQWVYDERQWIYHTVVDRKALPIGDTVWFVFEGLAGPCEVAIRGRWEDTNDTSFVMWCQHFSDDMFIENAIDFEPIGDSFDITVRFLPLEDNDWFRGLYLKNVRYGIDLPDRRAFTRMAPYQPGWDWGPKLTTCGIWKPVYVTNKRPTVQSAPSVQYVREIEFRQEKDSIGQSFTFYKDGKPIFIKGANWIPVHSFPVLDSANKARYHHLLVSAKEAGFNMLRVWGGGIYEHDYFYDLCDSLGLMVWQDFIFAGSPYPDNAEMLNNINHEVHQQVSRIARHPSLVLWCGNNEVKNGWEDWGWQGVYNWTPEQRARLEKAMDTIFGYPNTSSNTSSSCILAKAVRDCDPLQRPYITTSPLYGWGHPECVTHGDSHYWGVWWGEEPFERYAEKTGRFMSEYGFQSYPMLSTLKRVIPENELYIDSPSMKNHQKHGRGREIIDKAMRQYYGFDSRCLSLEDYCYVSQLLQAWGVGYGIFQHIKQQPHCMGTLYWQLNDCWPVASWSSIDYYGNWKALHYRAQALFNAESGEWRTESKKWEQYYSVYPKDRTYPEPRYNSSFITHHSSLEATVVAETDLYDVYIDTDPHIDGHFTHNFADLRAGEKLRTVFIPVDPKADVSKVKITVRSLNDIYLKHR